MKESILISGTLGVFGFILIVVKSHAAIPKEYNQILIPGHVIDGWHRAGENHYKFERRLIIGHDHPYDLYSSTKLYWPDDKSTYTPKGRITFFKCTNQTPDNAKALMHVVRGGMGTPELVIDVMYAPIRFMLINTMTITCDIYTENSDTESSVEPLFRNLFDPTRTTTAHTTTTTSAANSFEGKCFNEINSSMDITSTTQTTLGTKVDSKGTSAKSTKQAMQSTEIYPTSQQKTTKMKTSGKKLSGIRTSPRTGGTRSYNEDTTERMSRTIKLYTVTDPVTEKKLGPVEKIGGEIMKTTLRTTQPSIMTIGKDSATDGTKNLGSSQGKSSLSTEQTTLKVTSPTTIGSSPQGRMVTNPIIDVITSYNEDNSSEGATEIYILCKIMNLRTNKTSVKRTMVKNVTKNIKGQDREISKTKVPIQEPTTSSAYDLLEKFTPMGSKRKIGLAKIMY